MQRIGVLTSGGDSPGMNAAIRAVVRAGIHYGSGVVGFYRGFSGILDGGYIELDARSVSGIISRGGTILRSNRCKEFYEVEGRAAAAARLRELHVDGLVVIGGDGSYRGAQLLCEEHDIQCIGLPGTIDNDIGGTDYTIGFDTAMNTAMKAIDNLRDTAASHDRIFFVETMGRHSGYISIIAGIAGGAEEVLVPERPTDLQRLAQQLRDGRAKGKQSMIVVVAEGDDYGDANKIARRMAEISEFNDTRIAVIGHLQRGGSPTAFDRVLASRMGVRAVEALVNGDSGKMVGAQGMHLILNPLPAAWEQRSHFNPKLLDLSHILAT